MSLFFGPEIGKDQKKGLRRKVTGFSVQMRLETKQNEKIRSSPQISGVMVLHHNMVSPGVSRPSPLATSLYFAIAHRLVLQILLRICGLSFVKCFVLV